MASFASTFSMGPGTNGFWTNIKSMKQQNHISLSAFKVFDRQSFHYQVMLFESGYTSFSLQQKFEGDIGK